MRKILLAIMLLGLLLTAASCTGGGGDVGNWNTFIGGTRGVSMEFEIDSPPEEIITGDQFMVMVILNNVGEHSVQAGDYFVRLKGFSPVDFGTTTNDLIVYPDEVLQANELDPDSGEVMQAYPVYVQIPENGQLSYQSRIEGNTDFPFLAEVCYQYTTTAHAKLCIKDDLADTKDTTVCQISGPQPVTASGAPVQIINFQEYGGGPNAVRFSFEVSKADNGGDLSELASSCSSETLQENRVYIKVDTGLSGLSCTGFMGDSTTEGYVKLSQGSRRVACTQQVSESDQGDYVKIATITAEYDYQQSIRKDMLVKTYIE